MRAMSRAAGSSIQPDADTLTAMSSGAPQAGHVGKLGPTAPTCVPQYGQTGGAVTPDIAAYSPLSWWWYIDWMPTRPGPVRRAGYIHRAPEEAVESFMACARG